MSPPTSSQTQVLVIGGGLLAMLTALMLHKAGIPVTLAGEPPPTNPPLNPELMLIGGDDNLPPIFQSSLEAWRQLSTTLKLPPLLTEIPAQDLATSLGRVEKLRLEAMLDAIGGEQVTFADEPSQFSPMSLGSKNWEAAPTLIPATQSLLQTAVTEAGIPRITVNPVSLSILNLTHPQITLSDGRQIEAEHIVFTSARALRKVLPPLGLALPLRPARGHVLLMETSRPHNLPLLLQRLHRGHLFIIPVSPTRVDIHYDAINDPAQSTFNIQHSTSLVSALQQHISQLVPVLASANLIGVNTVRHWLTPDYLPAIGPWPGLPGVLVGTGWGGRGTAFAAGAAATLVEHITTGAITINIQGLAPNRFANGLWQVVKQPGSLSWQEPDLIKPTNHMSIKPDYATTVNLTEPPKAQYANRVQQIEKTVTESAARRPTVMQVKSKKITTAAVKSGNDSSKS